MVALAYNWLWFLGGPQGCVLGVGVMLVMLNMKTQKAQYLIFSREIEYQTVYEKWLVVKKLQKKLN